MAFTTLAGRPIEAQGRAIAGRAVLRLKDASGVKRELLDLAGRHETLLSEVASLRALIEKLPSPVWTRDAAGRLTFVNAAYARAVEARDAADAVERNLELLDSAARENIARARAAAGAFSGRLPAIVAGARRSFDVLDFRTETGSAGLGIDATEAETMRSALARMVDAHRRTLDQLSTGVAMFDADQQADLLQCRLSRAVESRCRSTSISGRPIRPCSTRCAPRASCPRSRTSGSGRRSFTPPTARSKRTEHTWHLPDGRTLRVVTTPNPDGGVTYLFDDVTERLDLERRFQELIRVQGETLDNLAEGVAVFGSDGRLRLSNSAFARMWQLSPQSLASGRISRPFRRCARPLHGDDATWQALRQVVTAIDSREAISGRLERRDGTVVDCTTVPLPDGATLVTFHDVTDSVNVERALLERNEALEDADRIKIDFVHHVSYELRSPLTNIIGFVHLLGDPATGPLATEAARISRLHHGLDQYAAGADQQHPRSRHHRCRPHAAQSRAGRYPRRPWRRRPKACRTGWSAPVLCSTSAPRTTSAASSPTSGGCGRSLFNLLANAVSFSPPGGTVTLRAERRADALDFSVTDHGPGIPSECWRKFSTGSRPIRSVRIIAEPGIGLSLVRSFVELHGGTVDIASVVGRGHDRDVHLPVRRRRQPDGSLSGDAMRGRRTTKCPHATGRGPRICASRNPAAHS